LPENDEAPPANVLVDIRSNQPIYFRGISVCSSNFRVKDSRLGAKKAAHLSRSEGICPPALFYALQHGRFELIDRHCGARDDNSKKCPAGDFHSLSGRSNSISEQTINWKSGKA
jgi:hypothetical protein